MFSIGKRSVAARCSTVVDHLSQHQQRLISHYTVLGVVPTANLEEIKAAFRKKAKVIHPDAAPHRDTSSSSTGSNHKEWVQLLTAYQILSDARSRYLYDLSLSSSSSSFLRQAAASGLKNGRHEDVEIDLNWNLGRAWTKNPLNNQQKGDKDSKNSATTRTTTVLDHLRTNLESDWHTALRHAYLGPRIDDLQHGQLPDCFEADERATQNTNEVLQLVSGRQELGSVRLRAAGMLTESEKKAWLGQGQCNHSEVKKDPALLVAFEVATKLMPAGNTPKDDRMKNNDDGSENSDASLQKNGTIKEQSGAESGSTYTSKPSRIAKQPQILDLYLGDDVIATAVSRPAAVSGAASTAIDTSDTAAPIDGSTKEEDETTIQGILTTYFYRGDTLLAQLIEGEPSLATTRRYSASKLLDSSGNHIFSIIRNVTPLVRHVTFVAEHTNTAAAKKEKSNIHKGFSNTTTDASTTSPPQNSTFAGIKKKTIVARCQRAWLPPSYFWLFKPRSYDHDIGGWVINWAGETQKKHPQWLDPSVLTLVAALDTLDYEKAKQQPYGLFERLRRGRSVQSTGGGNRDCNGETDKESKHSTDVDVDGARKVLSWVRDMVRFHRGGGNK
ncbi:hypothetical protein NADE_000880 [Nannochloris sp. 'desiccata']|nr:hypothetical protein NADE_000880 [Chlorella desiccata (nom. nud.)]